METIIKFIALILVAAGGVVSAIVYWALRNMETDFLSTANTTDNATLYFGYVETINFWPHIAWLILLGAIGVAVFLVFRFREG